MTTVYTNTDGHCMSKNLTKFNNRVNRLNTLYYVTYIIDSDAFY